MKKQLIAIGLLSFLAVPSVVLAEGDACAPVVSEGMTEEAVMAAKSAAMDTSECMGQRLGSMEEFSHGHGVSLYGSFRAGLQFGSGDTDLIDGTSRWGFQGSSEVSEGLTASFRYESKFNITNAESSGGAGHKHAASTVYVFDQVGGTRMFPVLDKDGKPMLDEDGPMMADIAIVAYVPNTTTPIKLDLDKDGNIKVDANGNATETTPVDGQPDNPTIRYFNVLSSHSQAKSEDNGGPGGRHSYVSLSGGFGTVLLGQTWTASANHYGFAVDPSIVGGKVEGFGGASYRKPNMVSYSSSAGDVSFQIDKMAGDKKTDEPERIEFGASAALGPIGVGLGYWSNSDDDASFTGVALSTGAAGVNLTIGLGSLDSATGVASDTSILHVGGSVGDSGLGYAVQVINGKTDADDQNFVLVTNSLGTGASLFFEHVSPGKGEASSLIGLKVDF